MVPHSLSVVVLALAWVLASQGHAAEHAWARSRYQRLLTAQNAFTQSQLMERGLTPLATLQAQRRQVRQAIFSDPYMMLGLPAVEIELARNGLVTLTVLGPNRALEPVVLPRSAWTELMDSEAGTPSVFSGFPSYKVWKKRIRALPKSPGPMPPPPPICHGWGVTLGATGSEGVRYGGAGDCSGDREKLAHVAHYARLAVSTRPTCEFDAASPFWSFQRCFSPPRPASG